MRRKGLTDIEKHERDLEVKATNEIAKEQIITTIDALVVKGYGKVEVFIKDGRIEHSNVLTQHKFFTGDQNIYNRNKKTT